MIIKIDHVAVSSMSFDKHVDILKSVGYKSVFVEKDIKNLQIKCPLLKNFHETHDLALLTSIGNFNIELINHRHINANYGYINPLFEFEHISNQLIKDYRETYSGDAFVREVGIKDLDALSKLNNLDGTDFQFNKIILKTKDIQKSIEFWECFGFKVFKADNDFAVMDFKSLFDTGKYTIYLQKSNTTENEYFLDDKGFNCIAFVSNSATHEKQILSDKGIKTTEIEKLILNGKELNIFFARGNFGEFVEIITMGINKKSTI